MEYVCFFSSSRIVASEAGAGKGARRGGQVPTAGGRQHMADSMEGDIRARARHAGALLVTCFVTY